MRLFTALLVAIVPSAAFAQTKEMVDAVERKLANARTAKWVFALEAPDGGFYLAPNETKPMLRATNGAVRALHYLGHPLINKEKEKHAAFVLKCYDPKTGTFAEPGGKPDVATTSIGVMVAMELGIPKEKFAKAMDYLKENAKTFEDVRIGAAAVEAWGVKDCPFKLDEWFKVASDADKEPRDDPKDGGARTLGSVAAMFHRLNIHYLMPGSTVVTDCLRNGQRGDGGWSKKGEKVSDIESTYRVMRASYLLKKQWAEGEKQPDWAAVRKFVNSHRNADDGYATKPGDKSSVSGVYYATIIGKWLDELEKK